MAQPTFRRYWVKVRDGSFFPQFDEDGTEYEWQQIDIKPDAVLFLPFAEDHAAKVRAKGVIAEVAALPAIEINTAGEDVSWCRPSFIRVVPHTMCGFCGAELAEGVEAVCPRCKASNHWYCDVCDSFKIPKFDKHQNALCPDCEVPRGLMRINQIWENWDERHTHFNVLQIGNKRRLIFDFRVNK